MQISGNTILITGGGSGIGRALAQRWHDLGNQVVIAGRRRDALEETAAGRRNIAILEFDAQDAPGIEAFARTVVERHPDLNILVNNAGIMRSEDLTARRSLEDAEATITTNLLGPIRLTNALIDHLASRPTSAIINVTSGLAFVPLPSAPVYSATKAALHSYTISLREQLQGQVQVTEIAPPAVQTDLTPGQSTRAGYQPLEEFADEVIALWTADPAADEILVERVKPLRFAERDSSTRATLDHFRAMAAQQTGH